MGVALLIGTPIYNLNLIQTVLQNDHISIELATLAGKAKINVSGLPRVLLY